MVKLDVMRKTLMMIAAVVSRRWAPRMRPAGYAGSSSGLPLICGMTATPVSKPERPRASFGKTSRATPTIISGLPFCRNSIPHQSEIAVGWWNTSTMEVPTTMTFSAR